MSNYFEYKLTYNNIFFTYTNKPTIDEREIHTYHELLFYLGDEITLLTEAFRKQIKSHTLIFIPKEKYHYFDNKNKKILPRLKISFPDTAEFHSLFEVIGDMRIMETLNDTFLFALKKICSTLENKSYDTEAIAAMGAFYILFAEIAKTNTCSSQPEKNNSYIVSECIEYINHNTQKALSVKKLSENLHISESALTHTFKKEMGISIHKYIQQKRLIFAKTLIEQGNKPTKIYFECGYKDYSAFYKAYCKMFGYSPAIKNK